MTAIKSPTSGLHQGSSVASAWLPAGGNKVSQDFGVWEFLSQFGINAPHQGIDVTGNRGDPVTLPGSLHGVVQGAGFDSYGGGNFVNVKLDDGSTVKLFHLLDVGVHQGQDITGGTLLGHMDSTGNSTGTHLHFQVEQGGFAIDPWAILNATGIGANAPAGGSLNPLDALKNVNDLAGKLLQPQTWWKAGFVAVGASFVLLGIFVYFIQEEKQTVIKVAPLAAAAA